MELAWLQKQNKTVGTVVIFLHSENDGVSSVEAVHLFMMLRCTQCTCCVYGKGQEMIVQGRKIHTMITIMSCDVGSRCHRSEFSNHCHYNCQ